MAAPTYSQQFSVGLLGTVSNVLAQPMTFYRCTVCGGVVAEGQTGTAGRDLHTSWHAGLDAAAANASGAKSAADTAVKDAAAAKSAAQTAASDSAAAKSASASAASSAASASQAASASASSADKAATAAQSSAGDAQVAEDSASASAAALRAMTEQTGMCPLCRAAVPADKVNVHLTYHYRRAHGDPVEFPAGFNPSTGDLSAVDPPMQARRVQG